ncbi:MAG: CVNH domain-containing protein [Okeania sp.]|nr:CVNH domain-containing protein [Okeania sp.]
MKNRLFKAVVAFLFTVAISFGMFANQAWALGDFSQSCYNSNVMGSLLSSTCYRADGYTSNPTGIDLNPYIENVDGNLVWQPSNFIETCRFTELSGPSFLVGECKTRAQQWVSVVINLDDHITNRNGTLMYE